MRRNRHIYATSAQLRYLRMLLNECFSRHVEGYYVRDWDRILKREASRMIDELRRRLGKPSSVAGSPAPGSSPGRRTTESNRRNRPC